MSSAARDAAAPPCSPLPLPPELPEPVVPLPPPGGPAGVRGSVGTVDAGVPPVPVPAETVDGDIGALPSAAAALPPAAAAAALPGRDTDTACGPEASLFGVPVTGAGVGVVVDVTGEGLLTGTRIPVTVVPAGGGGVPVTDDTTCVTADTTGATVPVTGASVW